MDSVWKRVYSVYHLVLAIAFKILYLNKDIISYRVIATYPYTVRVQLRTEKEDDLLDLLKPYSPIILERYTNPAKGVVNIVIRLKW